MIIQHTESTSLYIHLKRLVAPDGDPDVVPVEDLLLVQKYHCWWGSFLRSKTVSRSEGTRAGRPGGTGGEADRCPGEAGEEHPAQAPPVSAVRSLRNSDI